MSIERLDGGAIVADVRRVCLRDGTAFWPWRVMCGHGGGPVQCGRADSPEMARSEAASAMCHAAERARMAAIGFEWVADVAARKGCVDEE